MDTQRCTLGTFPPDRLVAELAERQYGVVAHRQLKEIGLTRDQIKGRSRRGYLHPIHRGVYAVGYKRLGLEARWMAAVLAGGPETTLSHRAAGRLWRIVRAGGPVEVTRVSGWRSPRGITAHRLPMREDERTVVDGIPVTGVSRTLLDLAAVVSRQQLENALNEAAVLRLTDSVSLPRLLERYPRRRGTATIRAILADGAALSGRTVNQLEERFAVLLAEHGLPTPRFNADLVVRGRHFNVDCLWRGQRLIVELDGGAVHRTPRAFEADRERDRILTAEGWQVIRATWRQLRDDPGAVVGDVGRALRRPVAVPPTL